MSPVVAAVMTTRLSGALSITLSGALSGTLSITLSGTVHTGIIAIAARVIIATIALAAMGVLTGRRTALHRTNTDHPAGTVAVTSGMSIPAVGCIIMCV